MAKPAKKKDNAAKKDPSGNALAGVKAAFTDHLISGENITGQQMKAMLSDKSMKAAMSEVFTPAEMGRLNQISARSQSSWKPPSAPEKGDVISMAGGSSPWDLPTISLPQGWGLTPSVYC